jgi:choline dehydrogenase
MMVPTSYNCPIDDSLWAMIRQPTTLFSQLLRYLRHGAGWFLHTLVEAEIFARSSSIDENGRPQHLEDIEKDPADPRNLPDFSVMSVS